MTQRQVSGAANVSLGKVNGGVAVTPELAYHRYQALLAGGDGSTLHYPENREKRILSDFDLKIRKFVGTNLISPFFLMTSLNVMLWFPEELIRRVTAPLSDKKFWEGVAKRIFDILSAVMGFIFCSIFFFLIPLIIKFDSRGTVFYKQRRAGMNNRQGDRRVVNLEVEKDRRKEDRRQIDLFGRPFWVYKFRTMSADAEKKSGAVWAQKNDPRITTIGRILRFTHVDEIPQFYNVLCGEMSMVGPRPERPQLMPAIIEKVPAFPDRLQVKPGMTGIAQIVCGYDTSIEGVKDKLKYDMVYVNNSGLKSDISILLQTLWVIIRGKEVLD